MPFWEVRQPGGRREMHEEMAKTGRDKGEDERGEVIC